jgi:hypothetical protein
MSLGFAIRLSLNYCRCFYGLYFANQKNKIRLFKEYENVTQTVLLAAGYKILSEESFVVYPSAKKLV